MTDNARNRNGHRRRLAWFLALSAIVHASLLISSRDPVQPVEAGDNREVLSVQLAGAAVTAPEYQRRRPQALETVPPTAAEHSAATPVHASPAPRQAANDDGEESNTASRVRARVISEFARYFQYPPLARLRGWEGRVLLGFRVDTDGRLRQQRVLHTSGFAILDQAALDSLRRVERIADAGDVQLDLQVPVLYRLTDTY